MSKRRRSSLSPILDQILNGGACAALNAIEIKRQDEKGKGLFRNPALNRTVIFKYPDFSEDIGASWQAALGNQGFSDDGSVMLDAGLMTKPPIGTGLFIPDNTEEIDVGGYVVFMGQRNFEKLVRDYLGLDVRDSSADLSFDLKVLEVLKTVPSLDPFLLRNQFEADGPDVDRDLIYVPESEDNEIRRLISARIEPIVRKAIGDDKSKKKSKAQQENLRRFLDAIWHPELEEAQLFVQAFGITADQAHDVFSAWKGVTFYQYKFTDLRPRVVQLLGWLKSNDSTPFDIMLNRHMEAQMNALRGSVMQRLEANLDNVQKILDTYQEVFEDLVARDDPSRFRKFLAGVREQYWVLGFCSSSLDNTLLFYDRAMQSTRSGKVSMETMTDFLTRAELALQQRAKIKDAP